MSAPLADALADGVRRFGADTAFGLPGGGPNLEVVGALERAGLRFVLAHDETNAAVMAGTYGLLVGRTALALATRGPGAANGVNGVAQATLDRFPLLFVTDCVAGADRARVAHQRLDQRALLAPVTKASGTLGGAAGDPDAVVVSALLRAVTPPRGAVHLDYDPSAPAELRADSVAPYEVPLAAARAAAADVAAARRAVAVVGLGALDHGPAVRAALERLGCPVLTTYQAAGVLPEGHPQLAGLFTSGRIEAALLDRADLVVAIGMDPVEPMPTAWRYAHLPVVTLDEAPPAAAYWPVRHALLGPLPQLLDLALPAAPGDWAPDDGARALAAARAELRAAGSAPFGPLELVDAVAAAAPPGALVTVDAGAHFLAVMPFWPARTPGSVLISNGLATMGFALPAAIGAALARPDTPVVCCVGDGGLSMTLAELETLARLRLPVTVVVFDDAALSLIEIKQRDGQGGAGAVRFAPVDFAGVARAMGLDATVATGAAEVTAALAGGWDRPRLVDARIDPTPYRSLIAVTRG